ncbi:hypothetical protein IWQ62_001328 [Dispira parvispora]|uniref:Extracellular metalloproteinase n=1 Tax=Dispira parvispora TaxID=1520584 RepID=A0A9W8E8N6_9FUNG|nr:hypothetical protein IWQ62_001328 [Dispira parvispora]
MSSECPLEEEREEKSVCATSTHASGSHTGWIKITLEATPSSSHSKGLSQYYGTWSSSLASAIINAAGLQSAESASSFTVLVKLTKDSESAQDEISMTTPPKGDRPILHISDKVYHTLENTLGSKPHLREFVFHHELWHIVSNRLVGGAFNTECLLAGEAREIAEGLSDGLPTVTILASKTKQAFVELPSLKTEVTTRLYKRKANDAFIHGQRHVWDSFKTPKDLIRYFTTYIVFDIYWEYANKQSHRSPKKPQISSTHGSVNQEICY